MVHPISPQDALDAKASKPKFNAISPEKIRTVERLVLGFRDVSMAQCGSFA